MNYVIQVGGWGATQKMKGGGGGKGSGQTGSFQNMSSYEVGIWKVSTRDDVI